MVRNRAELSGIEFDWKMFPKNGVVVDVGCGLGNVSFEISKVRHDLMFVLEDRPQVIEGAKTVSSDYHSRKNFILTQAPQYWNREAPRVHASGGLNVRFIGQS